MAEFQAWAATGTVTRLRSWLEAFANASGEPLAAKGGVVVAERVVEQVQFVLEQDSGTGMDVSLSSPGLALKDGHKVTLVWVAPEDKPQGNTHCLCVVNQSTGAVARLAYNLPRLRGEPDLRTAAGFGVVATLPALFAALAWQFVPQTQRFMDTGTLLMSTTLGAIVLFGLGALMARWILNVRAEDDDRKIWGAVREALETAGAGRYATILDRAR